MTISVLQETGIQAFGLLPSESSAFGSSVTAGSSIQVNCLWANNYWPATATCADTANGSFGSAIQSLTNGTIGTVSSWKYDNSAAGADTPTVTFSASTGYIVLSAQEIGGTSGYDTSAAWNYQTSVATSANAVTSSSATPSSQPGLALGITLDIGGSTATAGTGYTLGTSYGGAIGENMVSEHLRYTSTSAQTATYTAGTASHNWTTAVFLYKESGGGVAAVLPLPRFTAMLP